MPITTYRDPATVHGTHDSDIVDVLQQIAQAGSLPPIVEEIAPPPTWKQFWHGPPPMRYQILWSLWPTIVDQVAEYQVVNLSQESGLMRSSPFATKSQVLAYLYGYLAGLESAGI